MKSICTRTRSRSRQTSLLDTFEAQSARSEPPSLASASAIPRQSSKRKTSTKQSKEIKRSSSSQKSGTSGNGGTKSDESSKTEKTSLLSTFAKRRRVGTDGGQDADGLTTKRSSAPPQKVSRQETTPAASSLTVTPSPSIFARNVARKQKSLSLGAITSASQVGINVTTPKATTGGKHPSPLRKDIDHEEVSATPVTKFIDVQRHVTLEHTDALNNANSICLPSFHQPWQAPLLKDFPKGVFDIDAFPHQCCQNAPNSHVGYSWMTSKRRCHCRLDADHCSADTTTETYMGTYGGDRYGKGEDLVREGWKAEQWWLNASKKERAMQIANGVDKKNLLPSFPDSVHEHLDYLDRQPELNADMRAVLMDWIIELSEEYKLDSETLYLSTMLVDRSLACYYEKEGRGLKEGNMRVTKDILQLVGCACTLIATKLLEITPPTVDDFVYISDNSYNKKNIIDMEEYICNALKFNLNIQTSYHYFERFARASHASTESSLSPHRAALGLGVNNATNVLLERLVMYLLDLSTLEYRFVTVKPSLITASAVYLARATLGIREPAPLFELSDFESRDSSPYFCRAFPGFWSNTLKYYTGYDMIDLEDTVKALRNLQEGAESSRLKSIFNKHKSSKYMRIALKPVVNESELGFLE